MPRVLSLTEKKTGWIPPPEGWWVAAGVEWPSGEIYILLRKSAALLQVLRMNIESDSLREKYSEAPCTKG